MNEQIMKILPAKKECECDIYDCQCTEDDDDARSVYNTAIDDCAAAIEKANLVRCPTEEEIYRTLLHVDANSGTTALNPQNLEIYSPVEDIVNRRKQAKALLALLRGEK